MPARTFVFHLQGQHDQQSHAGGRAKHGGDRTGYPEIDAAIEAFLDEPLGDWTTDDTKIGDMNATQCAGSCDSVAEQFTEFAKARGLRVYTTPTDVGEMGYEIAGDPAGQILDDDGNIVDGFYQTHTVNSIYVDGQAWPVIVDFTARQYGYDTPVKTDPAVREEDLAVETFHLQGQHDQKDHGNRGGAKGRSALDPSDIPVYSDEYGELVIESTGVDRIRQIAYDYDGGSDVFDVVIVENDDGTIAVDASNLYGSTGTIEGERALEQYLNDNDIDVRWDGERGTLHATHRAAVDAGVGSPAQKLTVDVEAAYSGTFKAKNGAEFTIGETRTYIRDDSKPLSVEIRGSIMDANGDEVGTFSRSVLDDGRVFNHSLSINPDRQGEGIGTAFLDQTEAALGATEYRLAAVNVGKYAWAARGYKLDTSASSALAATIRDTWTSSARDLIDGFSPMMTGPMEPELAARAEAVLRSWSDDLNNVYPADLLAVDNRFRNVFIEGPGWDGVRTVDDTLTAAAGIETFHLQGQHDQSTHGRRGGSSIGPKPPYSKLEQLWLDPPDDLQALLDAYEDNPFPGNRWPIEGWVETHMLGERDEYGWSEEQKAAIRTVSDTLIGRTGMDAEHQREVQAVAEAYGMTPDEVTGKIEAELNSKLSKAAVSMRVTPEVLDSVLSDGRFKNLFETGTGFGWSDQELRRWAEWTDHGIDPGSDVWEGKDIPASERPLYGYMDVDGTNGTTNLDMDNPTVREAAGYFSSAEINRMEQLIQYGDIRVEFKPSVRERTTFTFGDSLAEFGEPTPVDAPTLAGIGNRYNGWDRVRNAEAYGDPAAGLFDNAGRYVEAQVHGGLEVADIDRVVFGAPPSLDLTERLDAAGIKWTTATPSTPGAISGFPDEPYGYLDVDDPLAASAGAGRVIYVAPDGATITAAGIDDQGRPLGVVTRGGVSYKPAPIIAHLAHGVWTPVVTTDGVEVFHLQAVQVFHLQGQHDQQSHAGDRANTLGDVALDDLNGEFAEASTDEIVERFKLDGGPREYPTVSGGRLYRTEDGRYVTLDPPDDDGVYVEIHNDLYDVQSQLDLTDLEIEVEDAWREDAARSIVYHGTRDGETAASIMENGLEIRNETRGINNRWVGSAVYTTTEPELASQYGTVFEVDLPRAIADGVISPDDLSREPGYNEADAMTMIAQSFDDYSFDAYSQFFGTGEDPQTVVISANIPVEYVSSTDYPVFDEGFSADIIVFRFDPSQPRDESGRWTESGGGGEIDVTVSKLVEMEKNMPDWIGDPNRPQSLQTGADDAALRRAEMYRGSRTDRAVAAAVEEWSGSTASTREMRDRLEAGDPEMELFRDAIRSAPATTEPLYRGMRYGDNVDAWLAVEPGQTVSLSDIGAFTENANHAQLFGEEVTIELLPGAAALPISSISNTPAEREWLVAGDIEIVNVEFTQPEPGPFDRLVGQTRNPHVKVQARYVGDADWVDIYNRSDTMTASASMSALDLIAETLKTPLHQQIDGTELSVAVFRFDPSQPRDESGRWTVSGGPSNSPDVVAFHEEFYNALFETYHGTIQDRSGTEFEIEAIITTDVGSPYATIEGAIRDENGDMIGDFRRTLDVDDRLVINESFGVRPEYQGRGIGTAFLDRTEGELADMGFTDTYTTAVSIGKAAWAARGYRVADADRARTSEVWIDEGRRMLDTFEFTPEQTTQFEAVARSWESGDDVYPGDLLAIDNRFSTVLIDSDRLASYDATRRLRGTDRRRPWFDRNQRTLFAADVAVFRFDPSQPRDENGRWAPTGAAAGPTPPTDAEFDEAIDTVDPLPIYERMGIDHTMMAYNDFGEFDPSDDVPMPDDDQSTAHAHYAMDASASMNAILRDQDLPTWHQEYHNQYVDDLKAHIEQAEPTKHDIVVYRGLGRFSRGMEGARIRDDGFVSTSLDRRVAESFGNVVEIRVPAGSKAIAGNWGEFEVILAPGTEFDVTEEGVLDVVQ